MPNWCDNELTIEGPKEELLKFKESAKGKTRHGEEKVLNEENFIPYPKKFRELDVEVAKLRSEYWKKMEEDKVKQMSDEQKEKWHKKNSYPPGPDGFNSGGYEWCIKNWGTKWGFCHTELQEISYADELMQLLYTFDTAWSPPEPLIKKMGEMFPKLKFTLKYEEPGMCFEGILVMESGEVLKEIQRETLEGL